MRIVRWLAPPAFTACAALISVSVILCDSTLHAIRQPPAPIPQSGSEIAWSGKSITATDGTELAAWWAQPRQFSSGCVLVLHGVGDSKAGVAGFAPMFAEAGYAVLIPDSRAHGESGGTLVSYGLLEKYDVLDWVNFMRRMGCRRVFGLGESLGGAVLLQAAELTSAFEAIAVESSFATLSKIAEYRASRAFPVPEWISRPLALTLVATGVTYTRIRYGLNLNGASPVSSIGGARARVLLIHGLADFETPVGNSTELAAANPQAELWLVPRALHCGAHAASPREFRQRVLGWFSHGGEIHAEHVESER